MQNSFLTDNIDFQDQNSAYQCRLFFRGPRDILPCQTLKCKVNKLILFTKILKLISTEAMLSPLKDMENEISVI
jgi:hypothetical protein